MLNWAKVCDELFFSSFDPQNDKKYAEYSLNLNQSKSTDYQ